MTLINKKNILKQFRLAEDIYIYIYIFTRLICIASKRALWLNNSRQFVYLTLNRVRVAPASNWERIHSELFVVVKSNNHNVGLASISRHVYSQQPCYRQVSSYSNIPILYIIIFYIMLCVSTTVYLTCFCTLGKLCSPYASSLQCAPYVSYISRAAGEGLAKGTIMDFVLIMSANI